MPLVPAINNRSPRQKRKHAKFSSSELKSGGGTPLIFPGSTTPLSVVVTSGATLKGTDALQGKLMATLGSGVVESGFTVKSTLEHTASGQLTDEDPLTSAKGIVAEASQLDGSGRVLSLAEIED